MKKTTLLILVISLTVFAGCGKVSNGTATSINNNTNSTISNSVPDNKNAEIDSPKGNNSETKDNSDTITDINNWTHPVKYVFSNADVEVIKVDFKNNKTYPIFNVKLSKDLSSDNKVYYKNLIKQVATANGYWDYEVLDTSKNADIKVTCDRSKHVVTEVSYNNDSQYFDKLNENQVDTSDSELEQYVIDNVSEVKSFMEVFQNNKNGVKGVIYVERYPDANATDNYLKDYYGVYVGEDHSDHYVNVYRFAINKNTKEILFYDVVNDKYKTLEEWRKNK